MHYYAIRHPKSIVSSGFFFFSIKLIFKMRIIFLKCNQLFDFEGHNYHFVLEKNPNNPIC